MTQFILSPNAQKSLRKIKAYSLEQFGEDQTITYLKLIEKKLQIMLIYRSGFPGRLHRNRPDLPDNL